VRHGFAGTRTPDFPGKNKPDCGPGFHGVEWQGAGKVVHFPDDL
jgi:hypothetical protein